MVSKVPLGIMAVEGMCPYKSKDSKRKDFGYRTSILILTFLAYVAFHASRRPLAVVKNVLNRNCSGLIPPHNLNITDDPNWCEWAPFDGENANSLLGYLDSCFLFSYAIFMFLSGVIAERVNLRYFLSVGMILSGVFCICLGLAKTYDLHSYAYFAVIQVAGGAVQSTGWPSVVACMGNWFGKTRRGVIFGVWNAHTSIGNMLGAYAAGIFVEVDWSYSFIVPGLIILVLGFVIYLFLVPVPEDIGCQAASESLPIVDPLSSSTEILTSSGTQKSYYATDNNNSPRKGPENIRTAMVQHVSAGKPQNESLPLVTSDADTKNAVTFIEALKIPGVIEFSVCLFFSKLVCYTFLFWLPKYIESKTKMGSQSSAFLSLPFDLGGIAGGIFAGHLSDQMGASAIPCAIFFVFSIPMLFLYDLYASVSTAVNIVLQVICGALVNGPYALITTAVAAELGTHKTIQENGKALATVTAIIDGTGSIGAAVGPLLAGLVSETGWENVFYMVMLSSLLALLAIIPISYREANRLMRAKGYFCCGR